MTTSGSSCARSQLGLPTRSARAPRRQIEKRALCRSFGAEIGTDRTLGQIRGPQDRQLADQPPVPDLQPQEPAPIDQPPQVLAQPKPVEPQIDHIAMRK